MDRDEQVAGAVRGDAHVQVQLVDRLQVGHLQKQRSAVREQMDRRDRHRIVARHAVMARRILGRAVAGTEAVVPALGEMVLRLFDERPVERLRELDEHAVAMDVEPPRQLHRIAGVADALETAVVRSRRCPSPTCR